MAHTATLVDANNVRGVMRFPDLSAFATAVRRWAHANAHRTSWTLLAVDHGVRAEAYALSAALAVAFAGERTDADTVIVHAVDWLLAADRTIKVRVVTSDHLLRMRCTHELPSQPGDAYGAKRPRDQLARLCFEGSAEYANSLNVTRSPSPTDPFAASPLRERRQEQPDAPPPSRNARRRAARAAEQQLLGAVDEKTRERERAAAELHRRMASRFSVGGGTPGNMSGSTSAAFVAWYHGECTLTRHGAERSASSGSGGSSKLLPNGFRRRSVTIDDMCCYSRVQPGTSRTWLLLLALYAPLGACLVLVRVVALLLAAMLCVLFGSVSSEAAVTMVLRLLSLALGFRVRVRNDAEHAIRSAHVIVANHVSQFDGLPIRMVVPCATLVRETYTQGGASGRWWARTLTRLVVVPIVSAAFSPIAVPTPGSDADATEAAGARARVRAAMRSHGASARRQNGKRPLLVFPEGSLTNGRAGLMRFSRSSFSLGAPVTPLAMRVSTWLPLETDTIWSPLGANVLWTLFQPWHVYDLTVLPPVQPARTDEGAAVVAAQVAGRIAAELGIESTQWTTRDKTLRAAQAKAVGKARWLEEMRTSGAL